MGPATSLSNEPHSLAANLALELETQTALRVRSGLAGAPLVQINWRLIALRPQASERAIGPTLSQSKTALLRVRQMQPKMNRREAGEQPVLLAGSSFTWLLAACFWPMEMEMEMERANGAPLADGSLFLFSLFSFLLPLSW